MKNWTIERLTQAFVLEMLTGSRHLNAVHIARHFSVDEVNEAKCAAVEAMLKRKEWLDDYRHRTLTGFGKKETEAHQLAQIKIDNSPQSHSDYVSDAEFQKAMQENDPRLDEIKAFFNSLKTTTPDEEDDDEDLRLISLLEDQYNQKALYFNDDFFSIDANYYIPYCRKTGQPLNIEDKRQMPAKQAQNGKWYNWDCSPKNQPDGLDLNEDGTDNHGRPHTTKEMLQMLGLDSSRIRIGRVFGVSMQNAGIDDGDIVIGQASNKPKNGDIVMCYHSGKDWIKRYRIINNQHFLYPENPYYDIFEITPNRQVEIYAIVKHIIKPAK